MADGCSLSKKGFLDCGSSRGRSETVFLYECRDDLTAHLKNFFLSPADLKEYEVILQRAGLVFACFSSPSLWSWKVLEAFKAVSVPRTQKNTYQHQKSRRHQPCHSKGGVSAVWDIFSHRLT